MNHTRLAARAAFALVLGLALSGCGGGAAAPPPEPFSGDTDTVLTITVTNQQLDDVRMWLIVDGQRIRLGSLRSQQTDTFHHPMDQIRSVHLEFDVTLGRRCVTTSRSLGPGDNIAAEIPSNLTAFQGVCR